MNCPICDKPIQPGERLVLEYLPKSDHWMLLHLVPARPGAYEHDRYPGFVMHCGKAHTWKPKMFSAGEPAGEVA